MSGKKSIVKKIRFAFLFAFFALLAFYGIRHQIIGGGPSGTASIHAYCPFGGLEAAYTYFATGEFIRKLYFSNFILLGVVVLMTAVTGAGFCGWICPFGGFQEWLSMLGKKIFKKHYEVTEKTDHLLKYLKYVSFAVIIFLTYFTGKLVFEDYDPFFAMFHFKFETLTVGIILLLLLIPASLFIRRSWCRYLCPLGAMFSGFNWLSRFKIQRDVDSCTGCGTCRRVCQMAIQVEKVHSVPETHCIKCLECIEACPETSLKLEAPKFVPSPKFALPVVVLILFFGVIGVSMASGYWKTKASAEHTFKITAPDDIRGWMTLKDVSRIFQVPEEMIVTKFSIPKEALEMQIRKLSKYGITENELRQKIKELPLQQSSAQKKKANPDEIAGWMTLNDVSVMFDIPVDVLKKRLGLKPEDSADTQLRTFNYIAPHYPQKVREEVKKILQERQKR